MTEKERQVAVRVAAEHHVHQVRQEARYLAEECGMSETAAHCLLISVTELGKNLVRHATVGGLLVLSLVIEEGRTGVEVVCSDDGPGIPDVARALQDGYSTCGGLGGGLPGVQRLMDDFVLVSDPESGTVVTARKFA